MDDPIVDLIVKSQAEILDRRRAASPLHSRALARLGPKQYAIEGDGFVSSPGEQSVWHVDLGALPAPTCDCPAFISSQDDPATCKHIAYLKHVDQQLKAAEYTRIWGDDDNPF
jgi:hypothetical protein